ncbi:hypothetical protein, partial [Bacillus subtilis]|uniref:hypothetical protein n=1 Tax=Bacillus subtilis TaxID=1423 RepID=UPI001BDBA3DC
TAQKLCKSTITVRGFSGTTASERSVEGSGRWGGSGIGMRKGRIRNGDKVVRKGEMALGMEKDKRVMMKTFLGVIRSARKGKKNEAGGMLMEFR